MTGVTPWAFPEDQLQLYSSASLSGSVDAEAFNCTAVPFVPVHSTYWSSPACALGGRFMFSKRSINPEDTRQRSGFVGRCPQLVPAGRLSKSRSSAARLVPFPLDQTPSSDSDRAGHVWFGQSPHCGLVRNRTPSGTVGSGPRYPT